MLKKRVLSASLLALIFFHREPNLCEADSHVPEVEQRSTLQPVKGIEIFKSEPSPSDLTFEGGPERVFLVLHGLNNHPKVMDELVGAVNEIGIDCLRVTLTGHHGDDDSEASSQAWLLDIARAVEMARKVYPKAELNLLGFSAGGAAIINYLDKNPQIPAERAFLIAPAISLRSFTNLVRVFIPLGYLGIPAISVAPVSYRRYTFPSFKLYQALFDTHSAVQSLAHPERFKGMRLNFLLADGDELISGEGVREWIKNNDLTESSNLKTITFGTPIPDYRHQIIDRATVGDANWKIIKSWLRG